MTVIRNGTSPTFEDVVRAWQSDAEFRTFFLDLLASAPFPAYRWETPPVTMKTIDRPFEFVLLDAPGLDRAPDPEAFAKRFAEAGSAEATVLAFPNLGNDAVLIVPQPTGSSSAYGHLANFVPHAPVAQKHELWRFVGAAMEARVGTRPYGSAPPAWAFRGSTCGWTASRSIMVTHPMPALVAQSDEPARHLEWP